MDDDLPRFSIGTMSRMSGLSTHVLRKWESRYRALSPARSETGRRLYSRDDVARSRMIKSLLDSGHQMSELARLSSKQLHGMTAVESSTQAVETIPQVSVAGTGLAAMIASKRSEFPATLEFVVVGADPLSMPNQATRGGALLAEMPTLGEDAALRLLSLQGFRRKVVVYNFSNQKTLDNLISHQVVCLKNPVTPMMLAKHLIVPKQSTPHMLSGQPPAPRFSAASVAEVANASPAIECECPLHIAELLSAISAFERYSVECETSQPADRMLHAYLAHIAGHSRALFEEALSRVAEAEGFDLSEISADSG
jgi:DNA-binding transcriptional MerR regulator